MADTNDTPAPTEWVSRDEYIRRCSVEVQSKTGGEHVVRQRLHAGEVRYCYIDGTGKSCTNFGYWLTAVFPPGESSAVQDRDPNYDFFREAGRRSAEIYEPRGPAATVHKANPMSSATPGRRPGWLLARAYKIEIEVPRQEETEERPPEVPKAESPTAGGRYKGKAWIEVAYKRRKEEFIRNKTKITAAAKALEGESKTADDCERPLSCGYIKNVLRDSLWHEPARKRSKQEPRRT
jgi:hypothetical protein